MRTNKHEALCSKFVTNMSPSTECLPVIWIVFLFVHDYGFKNGTFTHHKLYHPVNKEQQIPVGDREVHQSKV